VVVTLITLGRLLFSSMAGYVFAKFRFPGSNILFWAILITLMIPDQVILIPLYSLMVNWDWLNTYQGLILPPLGTAFYIFLMKQYMQSIPSSLIDSARIDACGEFGIFFKIIIPLSLPGLAVMGVFSFVNSWNAFIWPLLVASRQDMFTIQVGLAWLRYGPLDWGMLMAGASAAAVPVVIVFLIFQRYVVRGLTVGAIKL
jgi:multiple sugar transport system permease protein